MVNKQRKTGRTTRLCEMIAPVLVKAEAEDRGQQSGRAPELAQRANEPVPAAPSGLKQEGQAFQNSERQFEQHGLKSMVRTTRVQRNGRRHVAYAKGAP